MRQQMLLPPVLAAVLLSGCAGGGSSSARPELAASSRQHVVSSAQTQGAHLSYVQGQYHIARDGRSRVYDQHVEFVVPGVRMTGKVTAFVLRPDKTFRIVADFMHGDKLHTARASGPNDVSSLEIDS